MFKKYSFVKKFGATHFYVIYLKKIDIIFNKNTKAKTLATNIIKTFCYRLIASSI